MKIEGLDNDKKKVFVGALDIGDCFSIGTRNREVYMIIEPLQTQPNYIREAVNLKTGICMLIRDERTRVTRVSLDATVSEVE